MIYLILLAIFTFAFICYSVPYPHIGMVCGVIAFFATWAISEGLLFVIGEMGAGSLMVLVVAGTMISGIIAHFTDPKST